MKARIVMTVVAEIDLQLGKYRLQGAMPPAESLSRLIQTYTDYPHALLNRKGGAVTVEGKLLPETE